MARSWLGATLALLAVVVPARAELYNFTDLGSLGGVRGSGAYSISGTGVVAGYSFVSGSSFVHAMVNDHGQVADLGTLGGTQSLARAVNSSGIVVGWAYPPGLAWQRAFRWDGTNMVDLGTFGGNVSDASDINDAGTIVGYQGEGANPQAAIFYGEGKYDVLGALDLEESWAEDINETGVIVGQAFGIVNGGVRRKAFVYADGQMEDLLGLLQNDSGWDELFEAAAINDLGTIVGGGLFEGEVRGFVATPIPEPGNVILLTTLLGVSVAVILSRRFVRAVAPHRRQKTNGADGCPVRDSEFVRHLPYGLR